ncbi:MAG: hypothetical protein AAF414_24900, partial [Pseudomonadota bacterium]
FLCGLATVATATAQSTVEPPDCGPFEVYLVNGEVHPTDIDNDGFSIGDRLSIQYDIVDADENVLGQNFAASTFVGQTDDGVYNLIGDVHHVYDNGTLHYSIVYQLADPVSPSRHATMRRFDYPVIGGSGAFAGVSGMATASTDQSGRRMISFDISCDGD